MRYILILLTCLACEAKPIKILSIDGGGIRGIIPIKILSHIESKINKGSITHQFDIMGGTSAGGIIVLLLNIPDEKNSPKYTAKNVHEIYKRFGSSIFYSSWFHKIMSFNGWFKDKYNDKQLNTLLKRLMGDYTILDTVKDVIIPAYDLVEEQNYFFRKSKAQKNKDRMFYLRDIARATSAAPTYFNAAVIHDIYHAKKHLMIDGGVSVNNPALSALVYAFKQYGKGAEYFVLSIGTGTTVGSPREDIDHSGKIGWASNIVPLLMDSVNDVTDYQMKELLGNNNYYRLQVPIDPIHCALDDASPENIKALEDYAYKFIKDNEQLLNEIIERIK